LSEAGCAPGTPPQLLFFIDRDAIGRTLMTGPYDIEAALLDESMTVRFDDVLLDWATCTGTSGTIDFASIGSEPGDTLEAIFNLRLTDCALREPPIDVEGRFLVTLASAYEDVCPP
jgi:hypothetical protein